MNIATMYDDKTDAARDPLRMKVSLGTADYGYEKRKDGELDIYITNPGSHIIIRCNESKKTLEIPVTNLVLFAIAAGITDVSPALQKPLHILMEWAHV